MVLAWTRFRGRSHPSVVDVVPTLRDIHVSLDAAAAAVSTDHEAALDDILAARLMVSTLLVRLGEDGHR